VIRPGREVFAKDRLNATTAVDIVRPAAGVWTVRGLRGSSLTGIRRANVDQAPTVLAGVSPGRFSLNLGYSYQPDPQHSTRFVERGANYEQELGPARGAPCPGTANQHPRPLCGEIHFSPAPGPGGHRRIYAITTMNGEITEDQLVATYTAPREPEPSRVPKLIVQRVGRSVRITWGTSRAPIAAARPMVYDVDVNISDGRRLLDVTRRSVHHVTIPNVGRGLRVTVRVAGVREDDTQGPMRTVILRPGRVTAT
jgi:hypothetical protein